MDVIVGYQIVTNPDTGERIVIPTEAANPDGYIEPPWSVISKLEDPRDDPEFNRALRAGLAGSQ